MGRDNHITAIMLECLRDRLNAIAAVLSDEAFNPCMVIAIQNQVLGALNNEAVKIGDFLRLQFTKARLEFRE
jgi:hypothetical protein